MGFLDEIGLAEVFKAIKIHLSKKVNSTDIAIELAKKIDKTSIGAKNGVAQLDASGTVPASQLPSYVDDVIEGYLNGDKFYKTQTVGTDNSVKYSNEIKGESGKIYIDKSTNDNKTYRYTTAGYVPISDIPEAILKEITQLKIDVNKLVNITWSELKALRDAGNLIPGLQYRITDYNCTTTATNTQSAGHQFDIIIIADSKSSLNECARAIRHDGDENFADATSDKTVNGVTTKNAYFSRSKLHAWKIWYCLDNDTKRFSWADATNGKGVIYRMIDEYNNDCPYDFKNIQFKRFKITKSKSSSLVGSYLGISIDLDTDTIIDSDDSKMFYTFSFLGLLSSLSAYNGEISQDATIIGNTRFGAYRVYNNSIKADANDDSYQNLNNIVFLTYNSQSNDYVGCYSNVFGSNCYRNSFGDGCFFNIFGNGCCNNTFGNNYSSNIFSSECFANLFGNNCYYNLIGYGCGHNVFNDDCYSNSLNNECLNNVFSRGCDSNSFGTECISNSFGINCKYNSLGDSCNNNSFGNVCSHNSLGNSCNNNSFGSYCYNNSLGKSCRNNSFGITSSDKNIDVYYANNKLDDGVQYVEFSGVGSSNNGVQNYNIKRSMQFTSKAKHTITVKTGIAYELTVAKQSDGAVVEYCEADLLKSIQTSTITTSAKSNLD